MCFVSYRQIRQMALPIIAEYRDRADIEVVDGSFDVALDLARERLEATSLGYGVAFPHARTDHVKKMVLAVGRSIPGVLFENSGETIHFIFVIGTPRRMVTEYLALVGAMARLLRNEEVRKKLMAAKTPEEFAAVFAEDPEAV